MREDRELNFHYDDAEVTLNVCLGRQFEGGTLYFRTLFPCFCFLISLLASTLSMLCVCAGGLLRAPDTHEEMVEVSHTLGRGLLHLGEHRHGAKAIRAGERFNLILWCRSSRYRAEQQQQHQQQQQHAHEHHEHEHATGERQL